MNSFDRIAASVPQNKTAALVTGKGEHWEPAKDVLKGTAWQEGPLPILPMPSDPSRSVQIGMKVGRLTVLGYGGRGADAGRWVVRCTCGMVGHQRAKYLNSELAKTRAMCPKCDYLEQMKAGKIPPPGDLPDLDDAGIATWLRMVSADYVAGNPVLIVRLCQEAASRLTSNGPTP